MADEHSVHYDAFISYRHSELDQSAAVGLHRRLESYRLPAALYRKSRKSGSAGTAASEDPERAEGTPPEQPKRGISRVFRDQDELPLSSNLSDPIEAALRNADWLIVICTPRLPESQWCAREIQLFQELHGRDHILTVLAEGEPEKSIPPAAVSDPAHPATVDVRAEDSRQRAKNLDAAVIALAARMFDRDYETLKRSHREQRILRRTALTALVSAFLLLFSLYCGSRFLQIRRQNLQIRAQQAELQENYAEARQKYAESMALVSEELLSEGRRKDALYTLRQVLPDSGDDPETPLLPSTQYALTNALAEYQTDVLIPEELIPLTEEDTASLYESTDWTWEDWWPDPALTLEDYVTGHEIIHASPLSDGTILLIGPDGALYTYDPGSGRLDNYAFLLYAVKPGFSLAGADSSAEDESVDLMPSRSDFLNFSYASDEKIRWRWKSSGEAEDAGILSGEELLSGLAPGLETGGEAVSDDGRYRIRSGENSSLEICEGETPLKILYDLADTWRSMESLGDTGCYALLGTAGELQEAWILNPDLEVIAHVPRYAGYDPDRNAFLQYCYHHQADRFGTPESCRLIRLPFRSAGELIRETDDLLKEYQPSREILDQYGILSPEYTVIS